jgi:hypothetical protein
VNIFPCKFREKLCWYKFALPFLNVNGLLNKSFRVKMLYQYFKMLL